jgi:LysR family glycine cleavage system transcriptional activator
MPQNKRRRLPSLNALRAFEAAARHLSFKDAASELSVSQSAVSHQIKALEEHLGLVLFTRRTRGIELTRKGLLYYPILRNALDSIAEGTERILSSSPVTVLTLQVYSTFTIRWLLPRLPSFQAEHEDMQVRLTTAQMDADFEHDDVDAAIMIGVADNPGLHYDHLFDVQMFPVCSTSYLKKNHDTLSKPQDIPPRDLLQVYPSANDWPTWLETQGITAVDMTQGLQLESYDLALSSAAQGMGIALAQQPYISRDLANGALVEMFPGLRVINPRSWYLACRKEQREQAKIEVFRSWLLKQVALDQQLQLDHDAN